ncbi:MAG: phosphoribosylaminoimidazolesuccinocarboxamide synthase [Anaeroplasmataceae bacterium]|nr:phosphoribosylaminoimidazolesuccinocarboxamide synthase [Anaeroplasmataceae bacterium]
MEQLEMLYEGKAKQIFKTDNPDIILMHFKDDATAYNGIKKAQIFNKGILNNKITTIIFNKLKAQGIPTHYIKTLNDRDQLCKKVTIFPLEVIVRNIVAGSMSKRLGIKEGTTPNNAIFELCYKNDALGDPLINDHHAVALNAASYEELKVIYQITSQINLILKELFLKVGVILVDFKIEFGKTNDGQIVLADEISPDTARLWDEKTKDKLDKDRFRRDLGNVIDAYEEIYNRLLSIE